MPQNLRVERLSEWIDPAVLFTALEASNENVFWLDAGSAATAGWSFLGTGERASVSRVRAATAQRSPAADAEGGEWEAGPFRGGWVGWFAYESAALGAGAPACTPAPAAEVPPEDSDAWLRAHTWVAFDHATGAAWAVASGDEWRWWSAWVADAGSAPPAPDRPAGEHPPGTPGDARVAARHSALEYAALIARCHDAIRAGDAYQLCLTTRFEIESSDAAPAVYARLRAASPAHHGGFVRIGGVSLLSASPEEFLSVKDGVVRTRPIKGTRPRGPDADSDARLVRELVASEKERAENIMIVDLMRNDLSRVCEVGSVRVDALLDVETYPQVHQLVSTVSGLLRPGMTVGELIDRTFPAGSMTGAPKPSAMAILRTLERGPRGVYAGCFGWIGCDGGLDLAMVIRSIVMRDGRAVVGAGGGITWSSDPWDEVREVGIKARAPLRALGAALPAGW